MNKVKTLYYRDEKLKSNDHFMRQQNVTVFLSTSDYITLLYTLRRILKSEFEIFKFDLKSIIMIVKVISFNLNHKFESKSHNILRKAKLILLPFVICS